MTKVMFVVASSCAFLHWPLICTLVVSFPICQTTRVNVWPSVLGKQVVLACYVLLWKVGVAEIFCSCFMMRDMVRCKEGIGPPLSLLYIFFYKCLGISEPLRITVLFCIKRYFLFLYLNPYCHGRDCSALDNDSMQ